MPARTKSAAHGLSAITSSHTARPAGLPLASAKIPTPGEQGRGKQHQPKGRNLDSGSQCLVIVSQGICWTWAMNEEHYLIVVFS